MPFSVVLPNGSSNGAPILVALTNPAAAGTLIHQCHASIPQEVYVWACNNSSATVDLTLQFYDGATLVGTKAIGLAARQGDVAILAGNRLTALSVRAVASVANVVVVSANINQTG